MMNNLNRTERSVLKKIQALKKRKKKPKKKTTVKKTSVKKAISFPKVKKIKREEKMNAEIKSIVFNDTMKASLKLEKINKLINE